MRLVLSDVHGNRLALEAVIADGRGRDVDTWWALGDLVAIGPDPVDTLELLTDLPDLSATRGNTERYVLTDDRPSPRPEEAEDPARLQQVLLHMEASFAWTRGALAKPSWLPWLDDLPLEVRTELPDGTRVLGVHAVPGRDDGYGITPHRPETELREAFDGAEADIIIGGHTHQATDRQIGAVPVVDDGPLCAAGSPRCAFIDTCVIPPGAPSLARSAVPSFAPRADRNNRHSPRRER
jgi:predicted phosphodiesterase